MKLIVVIAATLAIFGASLADEDKRTRIINFYKCLACTEDDAAREEYIKCTEMKPEKCKKLAAECKAKLMPDATPEQCWDKMCKNEDGLDGKIYDCIMNDEVRKNLDEEEKTQMKEFVQCARKVNKKYCETA